MSRRSYRRLDLAFLRPDLARWPRSGLTPVQRQEDAPNQELARLHGRLAKEQVDRTGGVDEARGARGLEISHDPDIAAPFDRGMSGLDSGVGDTDLRIGITPHQELLARPNGHHPRLPRLEYDELGGPARRSHRRGRNVRRH